eukprot:12195963-Prorocentrum_lima.AAC.1
MNKLASSSAPSSSKPFGGRTTATVGSGGRKRPSDPSNGGKKDNAIGCGEPSGPSKTKATRCTSGHIG